MKEKALFYLTWMAIVLGTVALLVTFCEVATAKERFKFEVGYNAVSHRTTFEYPDTDFVSGTKFEGNGVHGSASVKLTEAVSATARFDHNFLRRPTWFYVGRTDRGGGPNNDERIGASQRAEAVVGLRLPKVGTLEGGVARHSFARRWTFKRYPSPTPEGGGDKPKTFNSVQDTISWGPVIGLTREVRVRRITLGGGIWGYPRMAQGHEWSDSFNLWRTPETASAIRAEATVAYPLTSHASVKAGYSFFRTLTPAVGFNWRVDTIRAEHSIIARLAFTF